MSKSRFKKLSHTIYGCKYRVSTVGLDEDKIRKYVRWQVRKDKEIETQQQNLFK